MNIEIANRLVELRKKNGLSQEELAAKIGLSRQAVSKWERAEASPDTDNLICLAKLYGVSLDELLSTDQSVDEIATEIKEKEPTEESASCNRTFTADCPEGKIKVILDPIDDDGDDDDDPDGAKATINGKEVECYRDGDTVYVGSLKGGERKHLWSRIAGLASGIIAIGGTAFYVTCGLLLSSSIPFVWASWWTVYMLLLIVPSICSSIGDRRLGPATGAFVGASVAIYILLGFYFGMWGIAWVVFLSIPLWGVVASNVDKLIWESFCKKGYPVKIR